MVMRESMTPLGHPTVSVAFSANAVDWGNATLVTSLTQFSNYSQAPGLAAVDGGLLLAHGGGPGNGVTGPGTNARRARHGDSGGADLLFSRDGLQWRLLKRLWPMTGGYCTLEELEVDSHGAATKFGVLFEGGGVHHRISHTTCCLQPCSHITASSTSSSSATSPDVLATLLTQVC